MDLGVSLGGDGTVLHLASLFVEDIPLPPVVSFAMGTLGFLTPFDVDDFAGILGKVLDANSQRVYCTLRTRKRCEVHTCALALNPDGSFLEASCCQDCMIGGWMAGMCTAPCARASAARCTRAPWPQTS